MARSPARPERDLSEKQKAAIGVPMGRPRLTFRPEVVRLLGEIHCTHEELAHMFGCSVDTISARLRDDPVMRAAWEGGQVNGKRSLRRRAWELALAGDRKMLLFLMKNTLGMSEKVTTEHTGAGTPVTLGMSLETAREAMARFLGADPGDPDACLEPLPHEASSPSDGGA